MKKLGLHRVDGRSYWFAAYFNRFDPERMVRYAGQARADRFRETFDGRLPFPHARIVKVFDPDPVAAGQFADTFNVQVAPTLEAFARGLDGVIVPFPSGGDARDYGVTAPLVEMGIPLSLDRIILEQSEALRALFGRATALKVPMQVTCFMRYFAELLLPEGVGAAESVLATTSGEPAGYGADMLDLVDELMKGRAVGVTNTGDDGKDILRIRYADGRHAVLQLFQDAKPPQCVTAMGKDWSRTLTLDGTANHLGAMRQFEAFLHSIETRTPAVPYDRVLANAAILHGARQKEFGRDIAIAG